MAISNAVRSYSDPANREDVVLNAIQILSPQESLIFNMLGTTEAIATDHSFLTDTLRAAGQNATEEDHDYTFAARTVPARLTNTVQQLDVAVRVSDINRKVQKYHGEDELSRQMNKAIKEFGNDAEWALVRETRQVGSSGVAPRMGGMINMIGSNVSGSTVSTTVAGTPTFAKTHLDAGLQACYTYGNGQTPTDLLVSVKSRNIIDGFTQKTNTVISSAQGSRIDYSVSAYSSSFGTLNVHTHRYIKLGADATDRVLGFRPDAWRKAFLIKPYVDTTIARTGTYTPKAITGAMTLELRNPYANFFTDGFAP